jgi:3-oxoadipate enol-lactonase
VPTRALNGFRMRYTLRGAGPTLVYVHGGFASLGRVLRDPDPDAFRWQDDMAARLRLVSYHRRGCELSSCPHDGYDLANQVRDLEALLDHLDVGAAHLFASSAGGPIALLFAATRPHRVRSLVVQGSTLSILRPGDGVRERALAGHRLLLSRGPAAAFAARPLGGEVWLTSAWDRREAAADDRLAACLDEERVLAARAARLPRRTRIRYHAAELRNLYAYADGVPAGVAARVRAPTLVLHGARDQVFGPERGREIADAVAGAEFELVPDAGHGPVFSSRVARDRAMEFVLSSNGCGGFAAEPYRREGKRR